MAESATANGRQWDLAFVTNLAPPYRVPVWNALSRSSSVARLRVYLMSDGEPERLWSEPKSELWELHRLGCRRVDLGSAHIYVGGAQPSFVDDGGAKALIVGGWESPAALRSAWSARRNGAVVIGFYESTAGSRRFRSGIVPRIRRSVFRQFDTVVCAGDGPSNALRNEGVDEKRIVTTVNVVDNDFWSAASVLDVRRRPGGHHFVVVGQQITRKNVSAVILAFARVVTPEAHLHVVGAGPLGAELKAVVESHQIAHVSFHGHLDPVALRALFSSCDTLVLASAEEVWGLVVNEALAAGLQVIVTDSCGVAPHVDSMRGVFIVPRKEGEQLVVVLADAMRRASDEWRGRILRPQILEFSPERMAADFLRAVRLGDVMRRQEGE